MISNHDLINHKYTLITDRYFLCGCCVCDGTVEVVINDDLIYGKDISPIYCPICGNILESIEEITDDYKLKYEDEDLDESVD